MRNKHTWQRWEAQSRHHTLLLSWNLWREPISAQGDDIQKARAVTPFPPDPELLLSYVENREYSMAITVTPEVSDLQQSHSCFPSWPPLHGSVGWWLIWWGSPLGLLKTHAPDWNCLPRLPPTETKPKSLVKHICLFGYNNGDDDCPANTFWCWL